MRLCGTTLDHLGGGHLPGCCFVLLCSWVFARFDQSQNLYKQFMVLLMSQILENLHDHRTLSSDLRYAMMIKVSRRLMKLGSSIHGRVLSAIEGTLQNTMTALQRQ